MSSYKYQIYVITTKICDISVLKSNFIFSHSFFFGLFFIMGKNALYLLLVPTFWKFAFHFFFWLLRLYAANGFPIKSKAVITKILFGSRSIT